MYKLVISAMVILTLGVSDASACQRCGLFGRACRLQNHHVVNHHVPVQHVAAVVKAPDVFIVNNQYPAPIAAQGATVYAPGQAQAYSAFTFNPNEFARQSAELAKAAGATFQLGLTGYNSVAQTQLALQAQIAEPLARGQGAAQVLAAAGFSQPGTVQQSYALKITTQPGGQPKVEIMDPGQVNARIEASIGTAVAPVPSQETQSAGTNSMIAQKCARCHGLNLTEPKKGVFIDAGHKLDCDVALESIFRVESADADFKMPPDIVLTPDEIQRLKIELYSLRKPRAG